MSMILPGDIGGSEFIINRLFSLRRFVGFLGPGQTAYFTEAESNGNEGDRRVFPTYSEMGQHTT